MTLTTTTKFESVQGNITLYTIPNKWSFIRYKFFMGNSQRRVPKLKKQDRKLGENFLGHYILHIVDLTPATSLSFTLPTPFRYHILSFFFFLLHSNSYLYCLPSEKIVVVILCFVFLFLFFCFFSSYNCKEIFVFSFWNNRPAQLRPVPIKTKQNCAKNVSVVEDVKMLIENKN